MLSSTSNASSETSFSTIARIESKSRRVRRGEQDAEVIVVDYLQRSGELSGHISFASHGVWIRHQWSLSIGARVVLHLVLPDVLTPLVAEGTVAGVRYREHDENPWLLIWFDPCYGDDALLLRRYLREHAPDAMESFVVLYPRATSLMPRIAP